MREIKYRMWNKKEKKMYDVGVLDFDDKKAYMKGYLNHTVSNYMYMFEDIELMQFTGLHDKNGKEIYEGDIVHIPDDYEEYGFASGENYSIDYKDERFRLKPKYKPNACGYDLEYTDELEVIGNIYENPELLKGADNIE